jgi:hypothetical protein
MALNFKLVLHKTRDSIHMKMCGDFDGNSAHELITAMQNHATNSNQVFIHTGEVVYVTEDAKTGELVYVLKDQTHDQLALVSERDGEIFSEGTAVGPGIGTFPDLSPSGFLVFQTQVDNLTGVAVRFCQL